MTRESALHQVVHRRLRSLFGKQLLVLARSDKLGNFRIRIIQIAPMPSLCQACLYASRLFSTGKPMPAHCAFFHRMLLVFRHICVSRQITINGLIPIERTNPRIRTSSYAHTTSNAFIIILPYHTGIRIFIRCTDRTDLHTCRILAMLTRDRHYADCSIWIFASKRFNARTAISQNPIPEHSDRNIVSGFASDFARMACHASTRINNHSVSHANPPRTSRPDTGYQNSSCCT